MKAFIYGRKSVCTGKGESVENQIELCRRYISQRLPRGNSTCIRVYEDEGFSGKNTRRPRFQQMLRDIQREKPDFLLCYRLDRISRSVSDFSALIEYLEENEVSFVCIREEFDTSKPMGRAMMYIASVFAQLERETTAQRVRDNMLLLARSGRWLGGPPPMGFSSERVYEEAAGGKMLSCCRLKEKADASAAVEDMFRAYLSTRSLSAVKRLMDENKLLPPGVKGLSLPGIRDILHNPVYCAADRDAFHYFSCLGAEVCFQEGECDPGRGLMAYNKRDYSKKQAPRRPVNQWIISMGSHRGLIPGEKWAKAQELLSPVRGTILMPVERNGYALLSGLIECRCCGGRMFAKPRPGGQFDYICASKLRAPSSCPCQNLGGSAVDSMVWEELAALVAENGLMPAGLPPPKLSLHQKRALIRRIVGSVTWDGRVLSIFLSITKEGDSPRLLQ